LAKRILATAGKEKVPTSGRLLGVTEETVAQGGDKGLRMGGERIKLKLSGQWK